MCMFVHDSQDPLESLRCQLCDADMVKHLSQMYGSMLKAYGR